MASKVHSDLDFDDISRILNLPYPINQTEAATVEYVDSQFIPSVIAPLNIFILNQYRQYINFTVLSLNGDIQLDGDLWLA